MSSRTPLFVVQTINRQCQRHTLQNPPHFATKPLKKDPTRSRPPKAPPKTSETKIPPSEVLRCIRLPGDETGRKAAQEAHDFWMQQWKKMGGTVPQLHQALTLAVDDRPATAKTLIAPSGIVFAKDHDLGLKLWHIANPVPWAKRPHIVR